MFGGIEKKMHLPDQNFAFTAIVIFEIAMLICGFLCKSFIIT